MIPSAPVYSSTCLASSGVVMSPFATTGKHVERLTSRIVSYSARPEDPQARVRPCRDKSCTPLSSAIFATFKAFLLSGSHPVRNFSVTGTFTAFTTALRMRPTRGSSLRSADPARVLQTFFAGQPMLMSTICAPRSTLKRAAARLLAAPQQGVRGHHLGYGQACAEPFAQLPEGAIGDAGHRRDKKIIAQSARTDSHRRSRNFFGGSAILYLNMSA